MVRKIRLLKPYHGSPAGSILYPDIHDVCRLLVERGVAEYVDEVQPPPIIASEVIKRPRGRPRKITA